MEVYNTEEEQVQAIKQWWKENAVSIISGIVIGLVVIVGYQYWNTKQQTESQQASELYNLILSSEEDVKFKNMEILRADYSGTPYVSLAALLMAKHFVAKNEIEQAINQLKWVVSNTNDDGIKHISQQRLARLYLSKNNIELAEALVKGVKAEGFTATYDEIRGDINLAKNMPVQAKENYRLALAAISASDQRYALIKMKLDDLTQSTAGVK